MKYLGSIVVAIISILIVIGTAFFVLNEIGKGIKLADAYCSDKESGNYTFDDEHITTDGKLECVNYSFSQKITTAVS